MIVNWTAGVGGNMADVKKLSMWYLGIKVTLNRWDLHNRA